MRALFLQIVNMSISASWIVLAVLILRLLLKKAPKWIPVLLWCIVAIRLICPFSIESALSLIPSSETVPTEVLTERTPQVHTGISFVNNTVNPIIEESEVTVAPEKSVNTFQLFIIIFSRVWIVGVAAMVLYSLISYLRIKKKIATAVLLRDNVYQSEYAGSPFVLGLVKPKIYIPFSINGTDMPHVIAHEQAHIRRLDHWWKPVGFLLLALHWFNPLMWLGYILLCRDIELACDEKVIKDLDTAMRADYSQALLNCSVSRRMIVVCPLAFGENSIKKRIKSILNYKKPGFWIIVIAMVASVMLAVCFLTNPVKQEPAADTTAPTQPTTVTPVGGADEPENITVIPDSENLREKFPMYFDLDTSNGLDVYTWQMAENSYSCALLPHREHGYSQEELWDLHKAPASIFEMQTIVHYYMADHGIFRDDVHIIPIVMPISSYAYNIDDAYIEGLNILFWSDIITSEQLVLNYIIDTATFDIDGDGKAEECTLSFGPTSGLFTIKLSVYEAAGQGRLYEYFNIFNGPAGELSFVETEAGMRLRLIPYHKDIQVDFTFSIKDGNVVLTSDNDQYTWEYWGQQGVNSPFSDLQNFKKLQEQGFTSYYPDHHVIIDQNGTTLFAQSHPTPVP